MTNPNEFLCSGSLHDLMDAANVLCQSEYSVQFRLVANQFVHSLRMVFYNNHFSIMVVWNFIYGFFFKFQTL